MLKMHFSYLKPGATELKKYIYIFYKSKYLHRYVLTDPNICKHMLIFFNNKNYMFKSYIKNKKYIH